MTATKQRLIVVGNGMAGARTVEEIIARGGSERFVITMFGDEPHGNYNRISLSNVLAGSEDPAGIFLNPLDWYEHNAITLHAGVGVARILRRAVRCRQKSEPTQVFTVRDPWLEGREPVTPNQFRSELDVEAGR